MEPWASLLGILGLVVNMIIYQQKERKKMFYWKLTTDVIWTAQYAVTGATSAVGSNIVALIRSIVFMNNEHKWAQSKLWPAGFLLMTTVLNIAGWQGWFSILTLLGSATMIIAYWIGSPKINRLLSLPAGLMYLIYFILNKSQWGIYLEVFTLISSVLGIIRLDIRKQTASAQQK